MGLVYHGVSPPLCRKGKTMYVVVCTCRFLRMVSVLLFLNKIDILAEKLTRGRSIRDFIANSPVTLPDYESFMPTSQYLDIQCTTHVDIGIMCMCVYIRYNRAYSLTIYFKARLMSKHI